AGPFSALGGASRARKRGHGCPSCARAEQGGGPEGRSRASPPSAENGPGAAQEGASMLPERLGSDAPLLEVRDLCVLFDTEDSVARAVDGVSFSIRPGEILCLVGESGSGKSVTALSILGLVPAPGRVAGGEVNFLGRSLARLGSRELAAVRGREIALVFQEATHCLNP